MFQHVRKCPEPSRTFPYPVKPPRTIQRVIIEFIEFSRIDSGYARQGFKYDKDHAYLMRVYESGEIILFCKVKRQ